MLKFTDKGLSPGMMALAVAAAAIAVLGISLIGAIADSFLARRTQQFARARQELIAESKEQLRQQNIRLDAALNNMSQGLCMFNADEEIVVFNRRFLEMYKLSPQVVQAGLQVSRPDPAPQGGRPAGGRSRTHTIAASSTISAKARPRLGCSRPPTGRHHPGDQSADARRRLGDHARGRHRAAQAEEQVREQKLQMDAALDNISQGLLMFGADGRLILCNRRYLELYDLTAGCREAGLPLEELF